MNPTEQELKLRMGCALSVLRHERGLSYRDVHELGVDQNGLRCLERGDYAPGLMTLLRLAEAYEITAPELLARVLNPEQSARDIATVESWAETSER